VIRKAMVLLVPVALGALAATQYKDVMRYLKIKQMSMGGGHPEYVPVEGSASYPQSAAGRAPDGTGEFDSARRGGPASARLAA
jgi:hypothetical protein